MSICTGRTPNASRLLDLTGDLELEIPTVCFMEAHHAFKAVKAAKIRFKQSAQSEMGDVGRDPSGHAQEYVRTLAAADTALVSYLAESESRLLDSPANVLDRSTYSYLSDPTDDSIAGSVLSDAIINPAKKMAFFSEDDDYDLPSFVDAMRSAGIDRIGSISSCLAWCGI